MINRSVLTGRLTRDPEVQYTQNGTPVLSFILAVDRQFRDKQGNREADFVNCVIWRKSAESFANFTHKGSLVGIDGHIQTRNYENNQSQRVNNQGQTTVHRVVITKMVSITRVANNSKTKTTNKVTTVAKAVTASSNNSLMVDIHKMVTATAIS